jgi:hypothetical protein
MRVGIVRTGFRLAALPDAGAKQPRLDVAAFPYPVARMLGIALRPIVFALRILRPVERKSASHQPLGNVDAVNRTHRKGLPVLIEADRRATVNVGLDPLAESIGYSQPRYNGPIN